MKQILSALIFIFYITSCSDNDPTPTCSDGILNGTETDIDCGGTNCPSCELMLSGVYIGNMEIKNDRWELGDDVFTDPSSQVIISECGNGCFEMSLQHT